MFRLGKKKQGYSLEFVAFWQALGVTVYCALVAFLMWNGSKLFGRVPNYFGPFLALILFSTSALICALMVGYYPFVLWQKKQIKEAIRLVFYTAGWLVLVTLLVLSILALVN